MLGAISSSFFSKPSAPQPRAEPKVPAEPAPASLLDLADAISVDDARRTAIDVQEALAGNSTVSTQRTDVGSILAAYDEAASTAT